MNSHASNPIAEIIEKDTIKVYFSCRDANNKSSVAYLVIDIKNPTQVLELSSEPVLSPGRMGLFDDCGTTVGCMTKSPSGDDFFYYLGWNLSVNVPFRTSIGLALRKHGESRFKKYSMAPILDRDKSDPISLSYPWVLRENDKWKMWYGSHKAWSDSGFEMIHELKYAESNDGINWQRFDSPVLPLNLESNEFAMSRPFVVKQAGIYRMWYSSRGAKYQMGCAESEDGIRWQRDDKAAKLEPSNNGWDSEMIEYCSGFLYENRLYMLYCGNGYGASGFGIAVWS